MRVLFCFSSVSSLGIPGCSHLEKKSSLRFARAIFILLIFYEKSSIHPIFTAQICCGAPGWGERKAHGDRGASGPGGQLSSGLASFRGALPRLLLLLSACTASWSFRGTGRSEGQGTSGSAGWPAESSYCASVPVSLQTGHVEERHTQHWARMKNKKNGFMITRENFKIHLQKM